MSLSKKVTISCLFGAILLISFSSNPPPGRTGGPGESTCAAPGCHVGINVAINGKIKLRGLPKVLEPNKLYDLSVDLVIERGAPLRGGLQMMALTSEEIDTEGFSNPGENSTISTNNDRTYFEHNPAKNFDGNDSLSYTVQWSLDTSLIQDDLVIFYAAANFADGTGGSSGDRIVTLKDTFLIAQDDLLITSDITQISCPDASDGSITIIVAGGVPPYTYNWNTGNTTATINNLIPGNYSVIITDSNGQSSDIELSIEPAADLISPVISCFTDTLFITSCTPFSYPVPIATDNCGDATIRRIAGKGSGQSFEPGLHIELYEATDNSGNSTECEIVIINQVTIESNTEVLDLACYHDSNGSIIANPVGTNEPITVNHSEGLDVNFLPEGSHAIIFTDATGCQFEETIEIGRPDSISLEIENIEHPRTSGSGDGSIDIDVMGGTPPYSFLWRTEGEDFADTEDLELLFPGSYNVIIQDSRGCLITGDTIKLDAITSVVDPILSNSLYLYPNPTHGILNVNVEHTTVPTYFRIYNATGTLLARRSYDSNPIDLSSFGSGVYNVLFEFEDGRLGGKRVLIL